MAIKKLVVFSIIFTVVSVILYVLANIRYDNEFSRYVKAHEAIQSTIEEINEVAYNHPALGEIYKINDLITPEGILESFFWNENYCLKGKLQESQYNWDEHLNWLLIGNEEDKNYYKEIIVNNDTLYYLRHEHPDTNKTESYIFDYKSNTGIRVFGSNNSTEESIDIGLILLYGEPRDYKIIKEKMVIRKDET
jgi:hypothetical protein